MPWNQRWRERDLKYILNWEIDPDRFDEAIAKLKKIVPDESGKYPKKLSESFSLGGEFRGFRLVEATPEQQINLMVNAAPEMLVSFEPIIEFPKVVETHVKTKSS
jgi:hypothetical protein